MNYLKILLIISLAMNIYVLILFRQIGINLITIVNEKQINSNNFKQNKKQKYTHHILKKLLKKFIKVADKHNIKYWATDGTLLGVIRHENIIPWDDDIDLGVTTETLEKLKTLEKEFNKEGLIINYRKDKSYTLTGTNMSDTMTQIRFKENNIHMDIFDFKKVKDKYIHTNEYLRNKWPKNYYYDHEIENLKEGKLDDIRLNIPSNPFRFLRNEYGDWEILKKYPEHDDTDIKVSDYEDYNF